MGVHSDARPGMARKREWSGKVIQFENVGLRYGLGPEVLSDLTFDVHPNSFQFLTGPSGAGKTSLLRLMLMSLKPTRGVVRLFGREAASIPRNAMPGLRRKIGVVFQDFRLLSHLTTYENVALPLRVRGKEESDYRTDVTELLKWVGLGERMHVLPPVLSGGEKQRAAIARALIDQPEILLADEPTANLDSRSAENLLDIMLRLNEEENTTFIFSTHDSRVIRRARRVVTLEDGRIKKDIIQN